MGEGHVSPSSVWVRGVVPKDRGIRTEKTSNTLGEKKGYAFEGGKKEARSRPVGEERHGIQPCQEEKRKFITEHGGGGGNSLGSQGTKNPNKKQNSTLKR